MQIETKKSEDGRLMIKFINDNDMLTTVVLNNMERYRLLELLLDEKIKDIDND
jgi:hypothetical protein